MQNGLIFFFLQIFWISSTSAEDTLHLQFLLGCQAVIPCQQSSRESDSFKWFYKKDETSDKIQILFQNKNGVKFHQDIYRRRITDRSLVIKSFTENDQGMYWCENCYKDNCPSQQSTVIRVKKEILNEIPRTFYITAGNSFEHSCPRKLKKMDLKWTFEPNNTAALSKSVPRPEIVTSNKSIHIVNVSRADAGKYTCWTRCGRDHQKLLTINLCVITVHYNKDSSISCAVTCDVEFRNPNKTSNGTIGTMTISEDIDPVGSLNCRAKQMFDGSTTVTNTHVQSTFTETTGIPTERGYLMPVISGVSVALACLSLMALLIFYFRSRLWAACPFHLCNCGFNGRVEEETPVIYSSIIIQATDKADNCVTPNDCVYSEIRV